MRNPPRRGATFSLLSLATWLVLAPIAPARAVEWAFLLPTNTGIPGDVIDVTRVDPLGRLWIQGRDPFRGEGGVAMTANLKQWTTYTTVDGTFPDDSINELAFAGPEDVWFATFSSGLAHLANGTVTVFHPGNSPIPGPAIHGVAVDPDGAVWFVWGIPGFVFGGVGRYDAGAWTFWDKVTDMGFEFGHLIDELVIDTNRHVWVNTRSGGGGLAEYDGAQWIRHSAASGQSDQPATALVAGFQGDVWVDWHLGIMQYVGGQWIDKPEPTGFADFSEIAPRPDGTYWAGTYVGFLYRPTSASTWTAHDFRDRVANVCFAPDGKVWVGGLEYVARFDETTLTFEDRLNSRNTGLPADGPQDFALAGDGTMWTAIAGATVASYAGEPDATNDGVWRCFSRYNLGREPDPFDNISDIGRDVVTDDNGDMWVAVRGGGVAKWDGTGWISYTTLNSGLWDDDIQAIAYGDGRLWIAFTFTGIDSFDGITWEHHAGGVNGLPPGGANDIAVDALGRVWTGSTNGTHLAMFDGVTWTADPLGPLPGQVYALKGGPSGDLWIGTTEGLVHFDGAGTTTYTLSNSGVPANNIKGIEIARDGTVWVSGWRPGPAMIGGVASFDGTTWNTYLSDDSPLRHFQVTRLAEDAYGNIWIGTESEGINIILAPATATNSETPAHLRPGPRATPNPFRSSVSLSFELRDAGPVEVGLFDVAGRRVATRALGRRDAGPQSVILPGEGLSPGVYFYRIVTPSQRWDGKVVRVE
ncbi:MAG: two-component regulator propeller domain-containing protein [bacterium]